MIYYQNLLYEMLVHSLQESNVLHIWELKFETEIRKIWWNTTHQKLNFSVKLCQNLLYDH